MHKLIYLGRIEDVFDIAERGIALLLDKPLTHNLAGSSVLIKRPGAAAGN